MDGTQTYNPLPAGYAYDYAALVDYVRQAIRLHIPLYCSSGMKLLGIAPDHFDQLVTVSEACRRFGLRRSSIHTMFHSGALNRYPGDTLNQSQLVAHIRHYRSRFRTVNWAAIDAYELAEPPAARLKDVLNDVMEAELAATFPGASDK